MKHILLSLFLICILGCNNNDNSTPKNNLPTDSLVSTPSYLEQAKKIAKQIFDYVEQVDMKKMSKKQLSKVADPLQEKLDSFRKNVLSPQEIKELDSYRSQLVSEMIDRKVIRDHRK